LRQVFVVQSGNHVRRINVNVFVLMPQSERYLTSSRAVRPEL
jgi:hypothetical protein